MVPPWPPLPVASAPATHSPVLSAEATGPSWHLVCGRQLSLTSPTATCLHFWAQLSPLERIPMFLSHKFHIEGSGSVLGMATDI